MKNKRGYFKFKEDGKIEFVEDPNGPLIVNNTWDESSSPASQSNRYTAVIDPATPESDVDVYFSTGAYKIHDEKLIAEMVEISKYYNTGNTVSETDEGKFWIRFMRLHDPIINLKDKSKLNVIKYRRK